MRFVSSAWRRVFSHEERIETRYDGQLLPFAVFAACRILQVTPSTQAKAFSFHTVNQSVVQSVMSGSNLQSPV